MQIAVLADIHGNLPALEAVLNDARFYDVDGFIIAGDLTVGPEPVAIFKRLDNLNTWIVLGNNDDYMIRFHSNTGPTYWYTSQQWALVRHSYTLLDPETLKRLSTLPEQRNIYLDGALPIRVVHGSPRSITELIIPDQDMSILEKAWASIQEPVLICGHSHLSWVKYQNGRLALNPGAVCGGLDGDNRAHYAIIRWSEDIWKVEYRRVPYDINKVRTAFSETGLLKEGGALARAFLISIETGKNTGLDFVNYAYSKAREMGFVDCEVVPDDIWDSADRSYPWDKAFAGLIP